MCNFTDRQSYLNYRACWRAEYKSVSSEIRLVKNLRNEFLRVNGEVLITEKYARKSWECQNKSWECHNTLWHIIYRLVLLREKAALMCVELETAKVKAAELRKENKNG